MKQKHITIVFLLFLFSCNEPKFSDNDFVGIWKADDGAIISINKDGTCDLQNLNYNIVSIAKDSSTKLNSNGTWKIINDVSSGITGGINTGLHISYKLMDRAGNGGIEFYISGQGINQNKPPWDLFIWKGDPDEMTKYKFVKYNNP